MEEQSQVAAISATELQKGPLRGYVAGSVYKFFCCLQLTAGFFVCVRCALRSLYNSFRGGLAVDSGVVLALLI